MSNISLMSDSGAPKSAYELAMERLRKKDADAGVERQPVTDEQKAAIAEIRNFYQAKLAELEVLHQGKLRQLMDPEERAAREADTPRPRAADVRTRLKDRKGALVVMDASERYEQLIAFLYDPPSRSCRTGGAGRHPVFTGGSPGEVIARLTNTSVIIEGVRRPLGDAVQAGRPPASCRRAQLAPAAGNHADDRRRTVDQGRARRCASRATACAGSAAQQSARVAARRGHLRGLRGARTWRRPLIGSSSSKSSAGRAIRSLVQQKKTYCYDIIPATGRTKAEIAGLLGISRQHLYDILQERKPVSPSHCGSARQAFWRRRGDLDPEQGGVRYLACGTDRRCPSYPDHQGEGRLRPHRERVLSPWLAQRLSVCFLTQTPRG